MALGTATAYRNSGRLSFLDVGGRLKTVTVEFRHHHVRGD